MGLHITENAFSKNFVIDIGDEGVTFRVIPGCTGMLDVWITEDTVETLEVTLQHDSDSCPIHEHGEE